MFVTYKYLFMLLRETKGHEESVYCVNAENLSMTVRNYGE